MKYGALFAAGSNRAGFTLDGGSNSNEYTGNTGSGAAHNNLQPYITLNYIIKYKHNFKEIGVVEPPYIVNYTTDTWTLNASTDKYETTILASSHKRGANAIISAMYITSNNIKTNIIPSYTKNNTGDITVVSDTALAAGQIYIDSANVNKTSRVLTVAGIDPDMSGDISLLDYCHPVGSLYMSTDATNPGTLFGGTWVEWAKGKTIFGVNPDDTKFDTVEETGGAQNISINHTHTLSSGRADIGINSGGTSVVARVIGNDTSITAQYKLSAGAPQWVTESPLYTTRLSGTTDGMTSYVYSILPPYVTCYMWKRTA